MSNGDSISDQPTSGVNNVFEAILKYGHDEDFRPAAGEDFSSTDAPAGSEDKIEIMRRRVALGQPLWHEEDRVDYSGLTGAIRPRE
ncbi:MAG: hypothetical protein AAF497_10615 [Planctomycetota bacterium]